MEVPVFSSQPAQRSKSARKRMEDTDPDYEPMKTSPVRVGRGNRFRWPSSSPPSSWEDASSPPKSTEGESGMMKSLQADKLSPSTVSSSFSSGGEVELTGQPKLKSWEARRVIKRPRPWLENEPKAELNYLERPKSMVEDWRVKAAEVRARKKKADGDQKEVGSVDVEVEAGGAKKRMKGGRKKTGNQGSGLTKDGGNDGQNGEEEEEFDFNVLKPIAHEIDPFTRYASGNKGLIPDKISWDNIPKWMMGEGQGKTGGPPKLDFDSKWNYFIPPCTYDESESVEKNLPWKKKEVFMPDFEPTILTMVASFSVGRNIDLSMVAEKCANLEYNPNRSAALVMRIRDPECTALMFSSGKIILTGIKTKEESKLAARKYTRILQRLGLKVSVTQLQIRNLSAQVYLGFRVRLNHLALNKTYGNLSYEPELFPGLIIPLEFPKVKAIVFHNGSLLFTGAKSEQDMEKAYRIVFPLIKMYAP